MVPIFHAKKVRKQRTQSSYFFFAPWREMSFVSRGERRGAAALRRCLVAVVAGNSFCFSSSSS